MANNVNIISTASAYRAAIRAIVNAGHDCARIDKETFKVLYVNHTGYGKTIGADFTNHPNEGNYTTALKFKAVVNLIQNGDLWLEVPAQRAAAIGLDCPGSWIFCKEDICLNEALKLVKASEKEVSDITDLWNTIGISNDGYIIDEDGEEIMYPMPPTKAVVSWLNL